MKRPDLSGLTQKQLEALPLFYMPKEDGSRRTQREIAEEIGVHYNTITNWKKDPDFLEALDYYGDLYLRGFMPEAYAHLVKGVRSGSSKFMDLYLKAIGKLQQQVNIDARVEQHNEDFDKRMAELERELENLRDE